MSIVAIRAALEVALNAMSPALSTAWENVAFAPVPGTPYQEVSAEGAEPENPEWGSRHNEVGELLIELKYPLGVGTATIAARAELIRTTFYRGASFTSGGVTVLVVGTAHVRVGRAEGDRFVIPVAIPFSAQIQ